MSASLRLIGAIHQLRAKPHSKLQFELHIQTTKIHTHHLFDETPLRDLYSLNSLLASYPRTNNASSAWALFHEMYSSGFHFNAYTFTPVLGACSALPGSERGKQVHCVMIKMGADSGTVTKTALMDMYSKYGFLSESVQVFDEIEFKDVVTWNALISSFLRHGLGKEAIGVFEAMRKEGGEASEFTLCSVLKACASAMAFRQGKQVHGWVIVMGRDLVVLGTALIDFYSGAGLISESLKVLASLNCRKDDVMLNSLISGCVRNRKYKEAFSIICTMRPNLVALTSGLAACSEISDLWIGKQIHCVALRHGFAVDTQLCNVLIDMYAKCGRILNARFVFDGMCQRDMVSWTSIIDAYGSHGHGLDALELFEKMGEVGHGVLPNSVTFLAVLSACGHSGLVEQGQRCFSLVKEKYGLDPGPEHYACFIDILGRNGKMEDMWCMFHDMARNEIKPTAAVWVALLNSCCLNLDVTGGHFAAKHLLELEPNKPANYVLLSNFYAAIGRWDLVDELRSVMRKKGLVKEAGGSWTTVSHFHKNVMNKPI